MPVPGFLASFADKAHSAINASPLAAHLPHGRTSSPDPASQPSVNEAAAQGGHRSHALESIQHQFRAFQQQYSTTSPVQKIITSEKGVALDFDSVARDSKAQSKELYTWGQGESEDLKDVSDRLAYLNFVQGSLAASLALKLDSARAPLKALRDAENSLAPRRNIRAGMESQIARIEHDQQRGMEKKVAELKEQLRKAEMDDAHQEKEVELLKRKATRESEMLKWEAIREYGEKLVLLSQAATPIINALPTLPPTPQHPYTGAQATAATRASLQRALDNYKTGHINLPPQSAGSDLSRSDTRSFGETHASELSGISSETSASVPGLPVTPPSAIRPLESHHQGTPPSSSPQHGQPGQSSSLPINPMNLNQAPAPIPVSTATVASNVPASDAPAVIVAPGSGSQVSTIMPTVAETGVPVSAGSGGPGPASGSLHDIRGASASVSPQSGGLPGNEPHSSPLSQVLDPSASAAPKYETAEEEKRRLAREREESGSSSTQNHVPPQSGAAPSQYESAEEEKRRLEREEREKLLRGTSQSGGDPSKDGDEDLPPYQDY